MNIKQYLESKLSEVYYSNTGGEGYDEYLNVEDDAEEILQSILKAIMEKLPEKLTSFKDYNEYQSAMAEGRNDTIEDFESVIKDLLE